MAGISTYGKSLDNRSGNSGRQEYSNGQARTFDPYDRGLDYGLSDFDVRHNFTANGFRGTAARNVVKGPNFKTVDLSLNKSFALTERLKLQFRVEAFNLLNRANFDLPSNSDDGSQIFSFANPGFTQLTSAGTINNIVGTACELQFALKLIF